MASFAAYLGDLPPCEDGPDHFFEAVEHLSQARHTPEVRALAQLAGFEDALPGFAWPMGSGRVRFPGMVTIITPLVRTGLDTDSNLELLFGPNWEPAVGRLQRETRIYVLGAPPKGSPAYAMGMRGPEPSDPDAPAPPAVLAALPRWQRPLAEGEAGAECCICHDAIGGTVQTLPYCKHLFHHACIEEWLQRKSTCPLCRQPVPDAAPRPPSAQEARVLADLLGFSAQFNRAWAEAEARVDREDAERAAAQQQGGGDGRGGGERQRRRRGRGAGRRH